MESFTFLEYMGESFQFTAPSFTENVFKLLKFYK